MERVVILWVIPSSTWYASVRGGEKQVYKVARRETDGTWYTVKIGGGRGEKKEEVTGRKNWC